jgi:hypothetical protein
MNFKIIDCIQGSEEWENQRAIRPTASEFAKIWTGSGKPSEQRELYMRKLSIATKYKLPSWTGNMWTDRGKELEPVARERFIKETGFDVREAGICLKNGALRGASPDGLIYHKGNPIGGVEIKCYNLDKHLGILNKNVLPTENKPQVHGQLDVTGLPFWHFVLFCPEAFPLDFRIIEVTPDGYTRELASALDLFERDYEANWIQYLAEYEVDQLNKTPRDMAPVAYSLLNEKEEEVV